MQDNEDLIQLKKQQIFRQLRIGEHLVQRKVITITQLVEALDEQAITKELIGRLLVQKGFLTEKELDEALGWQNKANNHVLNLVNELDENIMIKVIKV